MSEPVLSVSQLYKNYSSKEVLKGIDLDAYEGEIVGIVGANGSGKTTFFRCICSLTDYEKGSIAICGMSSKHDYCDKLRNIRAVIEEPKFYDNLTGFQNMMIAVRSYGSDETADDIKEYMSAFGIGDAAGIKVRRYSMGMKQRLGMCRLLVGHPRLIILDEPINGLDVNGVIETRGYILKMAHEYNACVIVSSHILQEMEMVADRLFYLKDGILIPDDPTVVSNDFYLKTPDITKAEKCLEDNSGRGESINYSFDVIAPGEYDIRFESLSTDEFLKILIGENIRVEDFHRHLPSLEERYKSMIGDL